jgi:hypothetical protein
MWAKLPAVGIKTRVFFHRRWCGNLTVNGPLLTKAKLDSRLKENKKNESFCQTKKKIFHMQVVIDFTFNSVLCYIKRASNSTRSQSDIRGSFSSHIPGGSLLYVE